MAKSKLEISKWFGGLSLGSKTGPEGSCVFSRGLDYKSDPDYITANAALVKQSGTVVADTVKFIVNNGAIVYAIGDAGKIYKNTAGTWSLLQTTATCGGQGLEVYNDYMYYRLNAKIGRMKLSDDSFTDAWQTADVETISQGFAPIKAFLNSVYFANGRYLASWDDATFTAKKLTFPKGYFIQDLSIMGEYLVIAVNDNESLGSARRGWLFFWDGTSSTYNFFTEVLEGGGISSIHSNQEAVYIFAGSAGNIYRYNGATTKIKKIPNVGKSATVYVYPGGATNFKGMLYFGLAGGTSATCYRGIYSWGQPEIGYAEGLNLEGYPSAWTAGTGATKSITCIQSIGSDLYVAWYYGGTYGVDKLSTTINQLEVIYLSLVVTTNNPNAITREKLFFKPLASGESIELSVNKDQSGSYTTIGTASYAVDGAVTTKLFTEGFRCDDLQIRLKLTGTTTMPSVSKVIFEYEEEQNL